MALFERRQELSAKSQKDLVLSPKPAPQKPVPQKPALPSKGPYEKRGGIPRKEFPFFFKKGPLSIPYSRGRGGRELKKMGEKILKERFPDFYGSEISGSEIQKEIDRLRKITPKTGAQRDALREEIVRLEEVKKRAGF